MEKVGFEDLDTRKQELVLLEGELKSLNLEVENLTRCIENNENGMDWKALSSEVVEQNNRLRSRIWSLKVAKRNIENRIFSIREQIAYVDGMYLSKE